jgi:hypothetical protein
MAHDDSFRISDPTEFAEVDRFGFDLEFLQHFIMQRWSRPRSDAALRGATQEREREREIEGRGEAHGGERRALLKELPQSTCVKLSSKGSLYIGGGRRHPPFN